MTLTPARIEELRRLEEAATEPTWLAGNANDFGIGTILGSEDPILPYVIFRNVLERRQSRADIALVVALRNAAPELLAAADEASRLRALLSSRASCFEHAGNCCADWCDRCRAGRQWEADVDAAVGSPTTEAGE